MVDSGDIILPAPDYIGGSMQELQKYNEAVKNYRHKPTKENKTRLEEAKKQISSMLPSFLRQKDT